MKLKSRLKRLRFEADQMSQGQLSKLTDIAVSQISDYENDKIFPTAINLWILAKALNREPGELYEEVEE